MKIMKIMQTWFTFQRSLESLENPPGHIWLRKYICEERLSTENVAFWAPSIFQKLRVPDWRVSDSIDSRSNLWFSINMSMKNRRKSINNRWKPMNRWKSMKIKEILDPQTIYKRSRCQHQYTQKVSMGCRLQAAGCRPQVAGCKLEATGSKRGATGPLGASGYKPGATSIMFGVCFQDHFGMLVGFQKAVISNCICCIAVARCNYFSKYVG